ncbi:MAG TPA: NAD(P)-binding domain-containing protein [Thermoanaerobaculia bacterium]|nr:NAD(P)-binding domain-containing protein [Thermoanaerobaculia bacterium]
MKVGILGSGDVGKALGTGFIGLGHEVKIGSRDPGKLADWLKAAGLKASAGAFAEAAAFGEILVLATLWGGTEHAIQLAEPQNFAGKVVIDATNPLSFEGGPHLALGTTDSGGEQVQRWLPAARVVKAFNTVGYAHMVHPDFPGGPPDMFIAGNDEGAKKTVTGILDDFGWSTIDTGGIEGARLLEPLCILWVGYGMRTGTWNHAFKLLRK